MTELKHTLLKWRGVSYGVRDPEPPFPYMIAEKAPTWVGADAWREIATFDTKEEAEAMLKLMPVWVPDHLLTPERSEGNEFTRGA